MKVREKIKDMTNEELVDFLMLFEKEIIEHHYCIAQCPHRESDCPVNEGSGCQVSDKTIYEWFLEQDFEEMVKLLKADENEGQR